MLIVCSGEDSYRSREKARELEAAFRQKYDPTGSSVERLSSGKDGVEAVLSVATGGSLFSTRRFFRADGILTSCPKNRLDALVTSLGRDVENTIIVTVEDGELSDKQLKSFSKLPKIIHYPFPLLSPAPFLKWATEFAARFDVKDAAVVKNIADASQGDAWQFVNEFQKWRAAGTIIAKQTGASPSVYDVIDRLMVHNKNRWSAVRAFDDANAIVATVVTQARSLLLVRSGHVSGVHPFVAQKLSRLQTSDPAETYARLATAFMRSRTGAVSAEEALDVWG